MTTTCRVCNRVLKNPAYAAAGIGPKCARKRGITVPPFSPDQLPLDKEAQDANAK